MHLTGRLFIACGLVSVAQLIVVGIHERMDPKPAKLPAIGPTTLPEGIGDFTGRDAPVDERLLTASNANAMLNRVYENRLGDTVIANVGIWTQYGGIPHKPNECYPSAGWEIVSHRLLTIPVTDRESIKFKQWEFQRGTSRTLVAFWVHVGDDAIVEGEEIRQIRQRLRISGGNLPPLVKVMLQTDAQDVAQAEARLSRFVAALVPYTEAIR